jgi:hypothetical protein
MLAVSVSREYPQERVQSMLTYAYAYAASIHSAYAYAYVCSDVCVCVCCEYPLSIRIRIRQHTSRDQYLESIHKSASREQHTLGALDVCWRMRMRMLLSGRMLTYAYAALWTYADAVDVSYVHTHTHTQVVVRRRRPCKYCTKVCHSTTKALWHRKLRCRRMWAFPRGPERAKRRSKSECPQLNLLRLSEKVTATSKKKKTTSG